MPNNLGDLVRIFLELIRAALPVVFGFAVIVFLWGLVKFIFKLGGDEKAVVEGKKLMIWGLIALFVLVSFQAIISKVAGDLGLGRGNPARFLRQ